MKIALICTEKLPVPPVAGGAIQIYIEGILPKLSKFHEVTVFGVKHPLLSDEEEVDGVKYIRVAGKNKNDYVQNVKLKLNDDNFDLIHIFNRPRSVSILSKGLNKTKFSLSLHNEMFHSEKIPTDMANDCIDRVEFISTVSDFIANGVTRLYPKANDKLHTVYSGVSIDKYKPVMSPEGAENKQLLKTKFSIEDKRVVLFVGRLGIKKGVDKLIEAMKIVMNKYSDVALVVVGSKWYGSNETDEFTESIKVMSKSLNGPIVFTGFLTPAEIPPYYNIGDIFVCPSQWEEPLARVHYEAMAAGLPIITTNRGGNSEVVKGVGNGIVIDDYSNSNEFASKIIDLLENPEEAYEMGKIGRAIAEEKYNWDRVADDILRLFDEAQNSILPDIQDINDAKDENETNKIIEKKVRKKTKSPIINKEVKRDVKIQNLEDITNIKEENNKIIENKEKKVKEKCITSLTSYYLELYKDFID